MIFYFPTENEKLIEVLTFITDLEKNFEEAKADNKKLKRTIESLVKTKHTTYGDGYGFMATDANGQQVWVNRIEPALIEKDEEIKSLKDKLKLLE